MGSNVDVSASFSGGVLSLNTQVTNDSGVIYHSPKVVLNTTNSGFALNVNGNISGRPFWRLDAGYRAMDLGTSRSVDVRIGGIKQQQMTFGNVKCG